MVVVMVKPPRGPRSGSSSRRSFFAIDTASGASSLSVSCAGARRTGSSFAASYCASLRKPFSCICPSTNSRRPSERFEIALRRVDLGAGRDAGEHRGLGDGELLRGLAEAVARGLLDPVAAGAEVDVIEIELEDLVLATAMAFLVGAARGAQLLLEAPREERLAHLALVGALLRVEQDVLHDLLRDGRAALPRATRAEVDDERASDAEVVEAFVVVEVRVLGGEHGELHVRRQLVDADDGAPLGEDLGEQRAVTRDDARHLRRVIAAFELGDARQVRLVVADEQPARRRARRRAARRAAMASRLTHFSTLARRGRFGGGPAARSARSARSR